MAFYGGQAFVAASNPTLTATGTNPHPAVNMMSITAKGVAVKPILAGNAMAKDIVTGKMVQLNLTDPDSLTNINNGIMLVDQGDAELIYIANPGKANQTVSRLGVGTQLDDTVYATSSVGTLFVVDEAAGIIYRTPPRSHFTTGTLYTEAPGDSGVAAFVGIVSTTTGAILPIAIGFQSPSGLLFAPGI